MAPSALPSSFGSIDPEVSSTTPDVGRNSSVSGRTRPGRGMSGVDACRRETRA
jgi:hypothetical protein